VSASTTELRRFSWIRFPADPNLRILAVLTLVNSMGTGAFLAISVLYLANYAGIAPERIGLGLACGGICGIAAGYPAGSLADRWGTRKTLGCLWVVDGTVLLGYLRIHSFAAFVPLICVLTFVDRGAVAVRGAVIVQALTGEHAAVRGRAFLRAVMNAGLGSGAIVAGFALALNTRQAYVVVIIADAISYFLSAGLLTRVSMPSRADQKPRQRPGEAGSGVLRDTRYLTITVLYGILSLQYGILQIGLPLWIVRFTLAPRWLVSVAMTVNTALVVLLQVRVSRGTEEPRRAARVCAVSGLFLAGGCAIYGASHGLPAVAAAAVLLAGTVVLTLGEVLSSAGAWSLSFLLADPDAHGRYQGVFNSGFSGGMLLSGVVLTSTAIRFGAPGWLIMAGIFALAGLGFLFVTRFPAGRNASPATGRSRPRPRRRPRPQP
jgi:MFS family permease